MFDVFFKKAIENGKPVFPKKYKLEDPSSYCPQAETDGIHQSPCICKKSLQEYRRELGSEYRWSCQMMNDPVADDTIEFKRDWFRSFQMDEDHYKKLKDVKGLLCVDPAFRLKQTSDFTGFTVSKMDRDNFIYICEAKQKKLNPDGIIDEIFRLVETWNVDRVLIETVSAQIVLSHQLKKEMIRRNKHFMVTEYQPPTDQTKAVRIRGLVPFYAVGQILHRQGLTDLEDQLVQFPRNLHDDIIDSLANHIPYWKESGGTRSVQREPEGSYKWWVKKLPDHTTPQQKLFKDVLFKRRRF